MSQSSSCTQDIFGKFNDPKYGLEPHMVVMKVNGWWLVGFAIFFNQSILSISGFKMVHGTVHFLVVNDMELNFLNWWVQ